MARRLFSCSLQRLVFKVALICCLAGIAVPAWGQFETRATKPTNPHYGAFSIATGDFNRDGKLDVVVAADGGFSVMFGNGDGTFQNAVFYSTPPFYFLAVADFNNDGNPDIVLADDTSDPSTVSVYLGNGDGSFKAPIFSNTTLPAYFVAVGDFNGDGKPDIVIIDGVYISVLLGNGDGTFQPPSDSDSFAGPQWLAVGDFNNDHNLDVIAVGIFGSSYGMGVLLGNGNGTLQNSLTYPLEYVPGTIAVGYLKGDGNLDAVLGYDLGDIAVFLGNGDGSFEPEVIYDTTGIDGGQMSIGDLNLDGKPDVAIPSGTGVDLFWGNGDGTLQPAQFLGSGESGFIAVGDLNGDHFPDFVLASELFTTTMLNTETVSFSPSSPLTFPAQLFNTTSPPQSVSLTNNGVKALSIHSVKVSGEFRASNTCGSSVAAGASCTFSAIFQPKSAGTQTGLITITDSVSSRPQYIELSGSATAIKVSPGSLKFKSQKVGTKSSAQVVTAVNEGSAAVEINSYIGGTDKKDFSETGTCSGNSIQPGASCTVSVTFSPTKSGARSGTLYVTVPLGDVSPAPVPLSGTGT
ncbi:MAG: FG-GAP-like repeat-containing protein [Candidatus Sulfotelmatobacter sp.]